MTARAEVVTLAQLVSWCDRHETVLRWQFEEERLPVEWEAELASLPADTAENAVQRLALLKHYYRTHHAEQEQKHAPPKAEEAQEAARQLLRREPVRLEIAGHRVALTSRSYAAMAAIAQHDRRIRLLEANALYVERRIREATETIEAGGPDLVPAARRRLRRYAAAAERIALEVQRQRAALWAHALTPDGAPARSTESLPAWWDEVDPIWDAALLMGLMEAGAGRYARLGSAPEPKKKPRSAPAEEFGWGSLFATIERQHKLEPAALYDRDLYQLLTWLRAGAEPVPEGVGGAE